MRLIDLAMRDRDAGWELTRTEFFPDLTLLVGASGVGKTRILKAVSLLREIAEGRNIASLWGIEWETTFEADDGSRFCWTGAFESSTERSRSGMDEEFQEYLAAHYPALAPGPSLLVSEFLSRDGVSIIERDGGGIRLRGNSTPRLPPSQSALRILAEEPDVSAARSAIQRIHVADDPAEDPRLARYYALDELRESRDTLEEIRCLQIPTEVKLAIVFHEHRAVFDAIIARFREAFPQVSAVEVRPLRPVAVDVPLLRIREQGVEDWIPQHRISAGMKRALWHFARMALWPDGMVVLVDEFENSLGVNCIDTVTDDLLAQSRRMQFIVTSHHPYVINNIDTRHWKVVTREGGRVSARNASELGIDDSSHQGFIKLVNLPEYQEGITAP